MKSSIQKSQIFLFSVNLIFMILTQLLFHGVELNENLELYKYTTLYLEIMLIISFILKWKIKPLRPLAAILNGAYFGYTGILLLFGFQETEWNPQEEEFIVMKILKALLESDALLAASTIAVLMALISYISYRRHRRKNSYFILIGNDITGIQPRPMAVLVDNSSGLPVTFDNELYELCKAYQFGDKSLLKFFKKYDITNYTPKKLIKFYEKIGLLKTSN